MNAMAESFFATLDVECLATLRTWSAVPASL